VGRREICGIGDELHWPDRCIVSGKHRKELFGIEGQLHELKVGDLAA
jgi:hypothetical protein